MNATTQIAAPALNIASAMRQTGYGRWESHIKLSTYEVDPKTNYIKNEQGRPVQDILDELNNEMQSVLKAHPDEDAAGHFEGFTNLLRWDHQLGSAWPVRFRWVACFCVPGSNEGHYVHVEVIDGDGKRICFFTTKTFGGMDHGLLLAGIAACLLNGTH